jgi:quercetin dioxygenase-like cupin family protein
MTRYQFAWLALAALPLAYAAVDEQGFMRLTPTEIEWADSGTPGIAFATIAGDPAEEGFYIIRARFSPGVMSSPHYHPSDRHVTVISGTWWTGTDDSFDRDKAVPLSPGSYMLHPAGAVHYDGSKDGEVVVEIKGIGPAPTIRLGN